MGSANMEISVRRSIRSMDAVAEVTDYIRKMGYHSPVVLGFTLLRDDTESAR